MKYLFLLITIAFSSINENQSKMLPVNDHAELMKEWKVIKMKGLEKLNTSPTMVFQEKDSKLGGFAGCNNYFSTYTLSGSTLSFGNTGTTRKMCPDMSSENIFLSLLPKIARYELVKKELYLYDQKDEILIIAFAN